MSLPNWMSWPNAIIAAARREFGFRGLAIFDAREVTFVGAVRSDQLACFCATAVNDNKARR